MTTSGQTIIEMNRDSICAAALRKIGAIALGQTPSATEVTNASEALNNLVAEFQTLGMPLWARKDSTVTMVADTTSYTLGVGQTVDIPFPLKILQAWTVPSSGGAIQELWPNSIDTFNRLPTSNASGTPSQYNYQPFINYGTLRLWPKPDATTVANRTLHISYMYPFEGFTGASNTPYFPREWNNALIYGLTDLLAPEYGVPLNDRGMFKREAKDHLETALDFGMENASLTFSPQESYRNANSR
jgi:hypothetical protein